MTIPGMVCFAKVKGYVPWPARVNKLPEDVKLPRGKVPVFFFGTHQVSYVSENDIFDFEKYKELYGGHKDKKDRFIQGMEELQSNPKILELGYDSGAIKFLSQFYKFDQKKAESMFNQIIDVTPIDNQNSEPKKPHKRRLSSSNDLATKKLKLEILPTLIKSDFCIELHKLEIVMPHEEEITKEEDKDRFDNKTEISNTDTVSPQYSELKTDSSGTCKAEQLDSPPPEIIPFKSPIDNTESGRPKRASAVKFIENFKKYKHDIYERPCSPEACAKTKVPHKVKEEKIRRHTSIQQSKRNKEQSTSAINRHHSFCPHPVVAAITEEERNLRIVSQLSIIDKEIKRTLVVGNENYDMCRKLMRKLADMDNINLVFLCKVPEIVITMRKCRRYKRDDSIKSSASDIYQRFLQVYDKSDIDEKIEAGAELLKRDNGKCKSAQMLMDEIFVGGGSNGRATRPSMPSVAISSPSSTVQSRHSSSANTPLQVAPPESEATAPAMITMTTAMSHIDPITVDIKELLACGAMELIESYDGDEVEDGTKLYADVMA